MLRRSLPVLRRRPSRCRRSSARRSRVLRSEWLEPRAMLSGIGLPDFPTGVCAPAAIFGVRAPANAAPTLAQGICVNGNAAVTGRSASLSVLGSDDGGESKLLYTWSVTTVPAGGAATFGLNGTNGAKNTTVAFSKAGTYGLSVKIVDAGGLSLSAVKTVVVTPAAASIAIRTAAGQVVGPSSTLVVPGVSQALVAQELDQFGNAVATQPTFTWSTTSAPGGATAPTFTTKAGVTTVAFGLSGYYSLTTRVANAPSISCVTTVCVDQTLTSIALSPNVASVLQGATQQFTPQALDQFRQLMANQQTFTWSTTGGTITAAGVFTASSNVAACTVTAKSGSATGSATVTILQNSGKLQNAALASLVQTLDADGTIDRADMIQILRKAGADGVVDATEFVDLKKVLYLAKTLNIPDYVQALAADVVNGNLANATYQGQALGNLAAGSSGAQLNKLVDKWFLGADHPTLCNTSLVYKSVAGSLFPQTPSHTDEYQGMLGDCYFISALGTLADSNPTAVKNMFIDNGDGTFTVRFYTGTYGTIYNYSDGSIGAGFKDNVGTADYVTVDRMLPTSTTGILAYADYGASCTNAANSLWIPLAEKAYAQWNQTGKEGRDDTNAFASIQGGWMATVDAQVLGYNATDYIVSTTSKTVAINALAAKKAVTIGTLQWSGTNCGLYASHAYAIVGYNASTDTFTLYNPWGSNQPGQLTWKQLQATCSQMAVADTSHSVPISGAAAKAGSPKTSSPNCMSAESRELLAILASSQATHPYQARDAGPAHGSLPAPLVDAAFAADVLPSQSEA